MTTTTAYFSPMEALRCELPDMNPGDGLVVSTFHVGDPRNDLENMRMFFDGRGTREGDYKMLTIDHKLWMSDTDAERGDHVRPLWRAYDVHQGGTALVNGLGLGCIVTGLFAAGISHIDVVEHDERVVKHIGGWFTEKYGDRITIHHDDAYTIQWPKGTTWDIAWHDVWPDLSTDDLELMSKLHRKYGRRVNWQGSWGREQMIAQRRRDRNAPWRYF